MEISLVSFSPWRYDESGGSEIQLLSWDFIVEENLLQRSQLWKLKSMPHLLYSCYKLYDSEFCTNFPKSWIVFLFLHISYGLHVKVSESWLYQDNQNVFRSYPY